MMRISPDDIRTAARKTGSVLYTPRYLAFAALTAGAAFTFYALLLNAGLLLSTVARGDIGLLTQLVPALVLGYGQTTTMFSVAMTTVISVLIGVNLALVVYRLVELSSFGREGASTLGGMTIAVLAPACPACATALFAVAGLSSVFALLPYNGTEFKVLAVFLLLGSAYWITAQIDQQVCEFC